jgi:hypothetical protein
MSNSKHSFKKIAARWFFAALATLAVVCRADGQNLTEPPQRWLFIFDTSSAMKKRLPALKVDLENIFLGAVSGQLRPGDSIGVWTFNQKLHTGEFPLITWMPQYAAMTSSNLVTFLGKQHYSGDTHFGLLQLPLSGVIDNSERLTLVIFCDGQDDFKLTPYDDGINQAFRQGQAERKKSGQPFVLVVRTQRGGFVGATVNLPPGSLDIPLFPPLPAPVEIAPPVAPLPPVVMPPSAPAVVTPSLVIVGTNVGTNIDDMPKYVPPPARVAVTNPPPAVVATNAATSNIEAPNIAVSPAPTPPAAGAAVATVAEMENTKPTAPPVITAKTSLATPPPDTMPTIVSSSDNAGDSGTHTLIYIGAGLLLAAIALILLLALRAPRTARQSLITSSMANDLQPLLKK